ncbi:MAG TPA: GNAT family N-acetyltransferase [Chitinophagaceae bacterium]|nr:N-acetyltransferase [Chitinophagaceae bacterium]MCC6635352.1 N-acetyltransferase [Chitinophagaceae bacterium]HMZ46486.1 GNAT family N-acetyltransferase [Chitinophagaceae bacterium]HNE92690.1 GNAT family N-acetyltransferase [Chitinophagaceae bacterium]HNF29082.1 GNAT family N-acetyltransferase [Chitinophagaceae bacterium]
MEILHNTSKPISCFYIKEGDVVLAKIDYKVEEDNTIFILHTEVSEKLKGMNIGNKLLQKVADLARSEHRKIVPLCSFALAMFNKKEEYKDVWKQA